MPTGLAKQVLDVFLSTQDQTPGDHQGPTGRLTQLIDCQVKHYIGAGQVGERIEVYPRGGFHKLSETVRDPADGSTITVPVNQPQVLSSLGNQAVCISNGLPRAYDGNDWVGFPDTQLLLNKLSEEVFHTSDHLVQAPDGAATGGTTGFTWTEAALTSAGPVGTSKFGIKSDNGAWVKTADSLRQASSASERVLAKVVQDGTNYWVFWNDHSSVYNLNVACFNIEGEQQGTTVTFAQQWQDTPGYWDVTFQQGTVLLAEPNGYNPPNNVNLLFHSFVLSGGSILHTFHADPTTNCNGPVAWLTNDTDSNHAYLATVGTGGALHAYQVDASTLTSTFAYDTTWVPSSSPDTITGWVINGGLHFPLEIAYSTLADSQSVGPKYDPARRQTCVISVDGTTGIGGLVRSINSVCLVGRAFLANGCYYAHTYYQSGSGTVITNSPISVSLTPGDTFFGNASQTVPVAPGDYTNGNPFTVNSSGYPLGGALGSPSVFVSTNFGPVTIQAGDTISAVSSSGLNTGSTNFGIPDGTQLLLWTLAGLTVPVSVQGTSMNVAGSSGITGANGTYFVAAPGPLAHQIYTYPQTVTGAIPTGTFGAGGTATGTGLVGWPAVAPQIPTSAIASLLIGGTITVTGTPSDDGTKTIARIQVLSEQSGGFPLVFWSLGAGEIASYATWTGVVSASQPGKWHIAAGTAYDTSIDGANLNVTGAAVATNNGVFEVTNASSGNIFTTGPDASATLPEIFASPPPVMELDLALTKQPYQFFLQSLSLDYTYYGATVEIANSPDSTNNGTYVINWIDPTTAHTFTALPTNGRTDQVNQDLTAPTTVTIVLADGYQPELQPTWFVTCLTSNNGVAEVTYPQGGCFERGLAYADWRQEGDSALPANTYPMSLSSPFRIASDFGTGIVLPYRAKSFTAGETVQTSSGQATSIVQDSLESTVGLKRFDLGSNMGGAVRAFNELLLPGPVASGFTASGFHEQGVNLGPEAPFLVSESSTGGTLGVTPGTIILQAVWEWTDENGERGWSYPSPPLEFVLSSGNNTYTVGGRTPLPFNSAGGVDFSEYGITNRGTLNISVYRSATINGVPTVQRYKVTNDLNPNGLVASGGGFSFPDKFTWRFTDTSLDGAIINQEQLYTSKGLLPKFQSPPFVQGVVWENRTWVCGYDGAVWFSGDKTEGDGNWFFPGFRLLIGNDTAVACAKMEQYLVLAGQETMWYIPAQTFPNNTGTGGTIPTPSPLPFSNGCTGHITTISEGCPYSSTAGGVWLVTRDLKNVWLSEPLKDVMVNPITDMAIDSKQRLAVADGTQNLFVYDPIPRVWYHWKLPTNVVKLTDLNGQFLYQDTTDVLLQADNQLNDISSAGTTGIAPDMTLAPLSFAQASAVKHLWAIRLVGKYRGLHHFNAVLSYPDETGQDPTVFGPYSPDPTKPYVIEINPKVEEASRYDLRMFADFDGISPPGDSFSLELVGVEVGVDRRQGTVKPPVSQRVSSN